MKARRESLVIIARVICGNSRPRSGHPTPQAHSTEGGSQGFLSILLLRLLPLSAKERDDNILNILLGCLE